MNLDPSSTEEKNYSDFFAAPGSSVGFGLDRESPSEPRWWWVAVRWQENHGNLLLLMTGLILVVGASILAYQQTRVHPPSFPEARHIRSGRPLLVDQSPAPLSVDESVLLRVVGATDAEGPVRIALYDRAEVFNDVSKAFMKRTIAVSPEDNVASIQIPRAELPAQFALAAYQDSDGDETLSRNVLQIPIEVYGFSNDARSQLGPPSYTEAVIELPPVGSSIEIRLR